MTAQTPTDALRLVPVEPTSAMTQEGLAMYHSDGRDDMETIRLVYRAMLAAAPASPLPEGGGDDPHERWGILNHLGGIWTEENFGTERQARSYLERWQDRNPKIDLSGHKVIPVLITITAAPTGDVK